MPKIIIGTLIAFLTISCAPKPFVVDVQQSKDYYMDCNQLDAAKTSAEFHKRAARDDDHFKFRYIFPPTGFIAMYRFNKAEGNATKRIEHLDKLAYKSNCAGQTQPQMVNPQMNNRQMYNHYQNNRSPMYVPNRN